MENLIVVTSKIQTWKVHRLLTNAQMILISLLDTEYCELLMKLDYDHIKCRCWESCYDKFNFILTNWAESRESIESDPEYAERVVKLIK